MSGATTGPAAAVERLRRARRALVTTHASPDGDALGSELALTRLAERLGAECEIRNHDPAPPALRELPGLDEICVEPGLPEDFEHAFDLVVTVECPGLDRPGYVGLERLPILNLDHHPSNPAYGEVNYVDEEAPAVGEMVLRLYRAAEIPPTPDDATNMYVALVTDTGDFRYSNATPRAFRAAAELVAAGADPVRVADWVHGRRTLASVRLLGEALQTLELTHGDRLATMSVGRDAFERAGARPEETDELINVPRAIAGVEVVAFLKQWAPESVRVSLRSKGRLDVRAVASSFGGGGHTNAAGCTITGTLARARSELLGRLDALFEEGS